MLFVGPCAGFVAFLPPARLKPVAISAILRRQKPGGKWSERWTAQQNPR